MGKPRQRRLTLALMALIVLVAGCGNDDAGPETEADTADLAAFCDDAPDPSEERSESYVGSDEHVEELRQLRSNAPSDVREDLDLIIEHFDSAVDPADPESQLTGNFPENVNAAIARVTAYIEENCD